MIGPASTNSIIADKPKIFTHAPPIEVATIAIFVSTASCGGVYQPVPFARFQIMSQPRISGEVLTDTSSGGQWRAELSPFGGGFIGVGRSEDCRILERFANQLHCDRQGAFAEAGADRYRRISC
jgi:hypothetical protein